MRKKYIIDKEDLPKLIKGESMALVNGGAFSIEVNGTLTNGDVIKAILNPYRICEYEYSVHVYITEKDFWQSEYQMNCDTSWWNAPYMKESRGECL